MSDVLTHGFDIVNSSYYSRSTKVLSIRNCAKCLKSSDNKANTAGRVMIYISRISSEFPLCSYNGTVALQIMLNNQSSLNNRSFIHFLGRGGNISLRRQIDCYFQYVWYESNLLFCFRMMLIELSCDFFNKFLLTFKIRYLIMKDHVLQISQDTLTVASWIWLLF